MGTSRRTTVQRLGCGGPVTIPTWYDPQNFSDAGLDRTISDVGEFSVEFEYDAGDPSVGVHAGFDGVAITVKTGLVDTMLFFAYDGDTLAAWRLDDITVKVLDFPRSLVEPVLKYDSEVEKDLPYRLGHFAPLLKIAQEKWEAIEAEERRHDEEATASYDAMIEQEKVDHRDGKHNDGYDHPECPLCG